MSASAVKPKTVIVDGRGHLSGRLASVIAKELLLGTHVVVVRTEELVVSGNIHRNKQKWAEAANKKSNTNPTRGGSWTYRAPHKVFWKIVRGMLPHKIERGAEALGRLKTFEGIPAPYDTLKRVVVPAALRVTHLKPGREFTHMGELCHEVGWKHWALIKNLEAARKVKSGKFYAEKKAAIKERALKVKALAA